MSPIFVSIRSLREPMNIQRTHACTKYAEYVSRENGVNICADRKVLNTPPLPLMHIHMRPDRDNDQRSRSVPKTNAERILLNGFPVFQ